MKLHTPRATKRVINPDGKGPRAWCPACKKYLPAAQVPWDKMVRDSLDRITATYAAVPHEAVAA